jgi:hypothetical protein
MGNLNTSIHPISSTSGGTLRGPASVGSSNLSPGSGLMWGGSRSSNAAVSLGAAKTAVNSTETPEQLAMRDKIREGLSRGRVVKNLVRNAARQDMEKRMAQSQGLKSPYEVVIGTAGNRKSLWHLTRALKKVRREHRPVLGGLSDEHLGSLVGILDKQAANMASGGRYTTRHQRAFMTKVNEDPELKKHRLVLKKLARGIITTSQKRAAENN